MKIERILYVLVIVALVGIMFAQRSNTNELASSLADSMILIRLAEIEATDAARQKDMLELTEFAMHMEEQAEECQATVDKISAGYVKQMKVVKFYEGRYGPLPY